MIEAYLTDTVDIVTRVVDKWGSVSETTQTGVAARWEDKNSVVRDRTGKDVVSNVHLMLNPSATVTYQSFFKLKTRCGEAADIPDQAWPVKAFTKSRGFENMAWEVWL